MIPFDFLENEREESWKYLLERFESFHSDINKINVSPKLETEKIKSCVANNFNTLMTLKDAINQVFNGLTKYTVHTSHPMYFGLFNPRTNFPSIIADTIAAVYNPQLAAWSHAPFAVEIEQELVKSFSEKFMYKSEDSDGVFTTGGAEANLTALLSALNYNFPEYAVGGISSLKKQPVIYCSEESHHSLIKAARVAGLGINSIRKISTNHTLQISIEELVRSLNEDIKNSYHPLMIIATIGTTGAGIIDPIKELAALSRKYNLWLHADAAYGGALIVVAKYKYLLKEIEQADSISFDAHKWLSVSMGAGMFLTRHKEILSRTFSITADYMPKETGDLSVTDPFTHSIQWSRRFIGLKLYLSLLVFGWKGYEDVLLHQIAMGKLLKDRLEENGWIIFNDSELPVICFGKESFKNDSIAAQKLCNSIIESGKAWLSVYNIKGINTLRACITNYSTTAEDVHKLVSLLNELSAKIYFRIRLFY